MYGSSGCLTTEEIARRRADRQEDVTVKYPSVLVNGHLVHVYQEDETWHVWLNTQDMEFTGLCIGVGPSRDAAIGKALAVLAGVAFELQQSRA